MYIGPSEAWMTAEALEASVSLGVGGPVSFNRDKLHPMRLVWHSVPQTHATSPLLRQAQSRALNTPAGSKRCRAAQSGSHNCLPSGSSAWCCPDHAYRRIVSAGSRPPRRAPSAATSGPCGARRGQSTCAGAQDTGRFSTSPRRRKLPCHCCSQCAGTTFIKVPRMRCRSAGETCPCGRG